MGFFVVVVNESSGFLTTPALPPSPSALSFHLLPHATTTMPLWLLNLGSYQLALASILTLDGCINDSNTIVLVKVSWSLPIQTFF